MSRELEQAARDAIRFLDELPADLGRGSWNGFRVQIASALRAALAAPSVEPVGINYFVLYDFAAAHNIDYNALGTAVRKALEPKQC
jgi:hypothetical protein